MPNILYEWFNSTDQPSPSGESKHNFQKASCNLHLILMKYELEVRMICPVMHL